MSGRHVWSAWRWPMVLLVALLVLAVGILLLRDLPRRWVEGMLAERLDAEVELGRFKIRGLDDFRLEEIRIRQPGVWPEIQTARVPALEVRGEIRAILAGRYRLLSVDGLEVTLEPVVRASGAGADEADEALAVEADRVQLRNGTIRLAAADRTLSCEFDGMLEELGREPTGTLAIRCGRLSSAPILAFLRSRTAAAAPVEPAAGDPLAALAVDIERVEADLTLGGDPGPVAASARLAGVLVTWDGTSTELGSLGVRLLPEGGRSRLEIATESPTRLAESIEAAVWLDDASLEWTGLEARIRRLQLAAAHDLLASRVADWALDGQADVDLEGDPEAGFSLTGSASLSGLARMGVEQPVRGSELRFSGRLPADGQGATLRADLEVPAGAAEGSARPVPAGILPVAADLEGEWRAAEALFAVSSLAVRTGRLGKLTATGSLRGLPDKPELAADWTWTGGRLTDLLAAAGPAAESWGQTIEPHGSVRGRGTLTGPLASPSARATLGIEGLQLSSPVPAAAAEASPGDLAWSFRAQPFETIVALAGGDPAVGLSIPRLGAILDLAELPSLPIEIAAQARIDPASGTIHLAAAELQTPELGRGRLAGRLALDGDTDLDLRWTGGDLSAWLDHLAPRLGPMPDDVQVQGTAELDLTLAREASGPLGVGGGLTLGGGGFEAGGGSRVLQDLWLQAEIDGELTPERRAELRSTLRAGGFVLLWGTAFADYTDLELEIATSVTVEPAPEAPGWLVRGEANSRLAGGSTLAAGISIAPDQSVDLTATASIEALGVFLDAYLVQPLQGSVGVLDRFRASGSLWADLTTSTGPDTRTATGRLELEGIEAETAGGALRVGGLGLDLPFDLAWSRETLDGPLTIGETESRRGQLEFDELTAAGVTVPPFSANLVAQADFVALDESLEIPLLGGRVALDRLTLSEMLRPSRHAAAALRIEGLQLSELSSSQGWPPLEGEASGRFPRMRVTHGTLRVDGGGAVSVFGGEVAVSDISGAQLFSDYPRLTLSADFRGIDLSQLTGKLDFGEMSGTIEGRIRGLELFRGTPVRFKGHLLSVRRPGTRQTIGFRAIDNLAMLGGGGNLGPINLGVGRFFDRYRYRQLGVAMVLDNDHFLLRGLARRGKEELFIKGRQPLRLDMVNVRPGRTVSFRTMLDRLNNLQLTSTPVGAGGS